MGASGPIAAAILVVGLLAQGGTFLTAQRNTEHAVDAARQAWQRRQVAEQAHGLAILDHDWNATRSELNLTLNNTGAVAMNASRLEVLLDGLRATPNVTAKRVAGVATDVWAPGQRLNLTVTAPAKPADAAVVSPWGLLVARRGI